MQSTPMPFWGRGAQGGRRKATNPPPATSFETRTQQRAPIRASMPTDAMARRAPISLNR
jgi:hypothetical protein